MTDKDLEGFGLLSDKTKLNPYRYWSNTLQTNLTIRETDTPEDILFMVFNIGHDLGIEVGVEKRSSQFLNLLYNKEI